MEKGELQEKILFTGYYQVLQITDNLCGFFWQGQGNNCNSYLFTNVLDGERPHVIVDPGHINNEFREPCFKQLSAAMKAAGFEPKDIGLILNTHSHPDHCAASEILTQDESKTKPPLIAFTREEYDFLRSEDEKMVRAFGLSPEKIAPYFLLGEGDLNLGKISLRVLLTPGHSPGSACFYWPDMGVLITGDVVFCNSIGRTDLPGGNLSQLRHSVKKLAELEVEYLLPGHHTEYGSFLQGREAVKRNFQAIKMFFI